MVTASVTGTIGENSTTEQRTERVEPAAWVTNHPTMTMGPSIGWLFLLFDEKNNGSQLIAAGLQGIAMTPLNHEVTVRAMLKPTTRMG